MSFIHLTHHAKERAWSRHSINEKTLLDMCERSVMYGVGSGDCGDEKLARYLMKQHTKYAGKVSAYAYMDYVFIFQGDDNGLVLVTTYKLPPWLQGRVEYQYAA